MESHSHIVALLFRRIGDSLLATAALRAIKKTHHDKQLVVIAEPQVKRVFDYNPWIDRVETTNHSPSAWRLGRSIRTYQPLYATVDFLSDFRSGLACMASGSLIRIGFAHRGRSFFYTHVVAAQDETRPIYSGLHRLQLASALGAPSNDVSLDFILTDSNHERADEFFNERDLSSKKVVAVNVFSRRDYKRWSEANFIDLLRELSSDKAIFPLVLCGPSEENYVLPIAERAGLAKQHIFQTTDLGFLGAVLQRCTVYTGNDGGAKHVAVAVGTPTVTIFRYDLWQYWTPDSKKHIALEDRNARPIPVADALHAIRAFL